MILNCDARGLEWFGVTYLSQDKVAFQEIVDNVDQHTQNQLAFGLPSRLIAKTFVFRLVYGGSAYSYANDPNFSEVSKKESYWQDVIDRFYAKYKGIDMWHTKIVKEAIMNKQLTIPTGRIFKFTPKPNYKGEMTFPITQIKNYPVQGLGADIMSVIRVEFANRFYKEKIDGLLVNTVHDSIVCDVKEKELERTAALFNQVFADGPKLFEQRFGVEFNLPLLCEIGYGNDMKQLEVYK